MTMTNTHLNPAPVAHHENRRQVRRGETLYYAGDQSLTLYRLESGLLRAVRLTPQGRNMTVRHVHPGDIFGEEVLHGQTRTHQTIALTDAVVTPLHVEQLSVRDLWDVTRSLSTQLQRTMNEGLHQQDGDLRERIARYLLNLADSSLGGTQADGQRFVQATHELIAEGIGSTRESVSKLIGEMRDDGLLTPAYRCLTLTNEPELRRLSGVKG